MLLKDLNFIDNNIDFFFYKEKLFWSSETTFQNTNVDKYLIENNSKIFVKILFYLLQCRIKIIW